MGALPAALRVALLAGVLAGVAEGRIKAAANQVYFGVLSDWGGQTDMPYTTPGQLSAAQGLTKVAFENEMRFVVSAGGNFLESGLPGPADSPETLTRFAATFQQVYTGIPLQIPWYITAGLHDWEGNLTAEMALNGTEQSGGRWTFPDLWHTFTITLPPYGETVQFVLVDTETLTGGFDYRQPNLPLDLYWPPMPPARAGAAAGGGVPSSEAVAFADAEASGRRRRRLSNFDTGNIRPPVSLAQWEWFEKTLNSSTADWIIVVGNHPVWSVGQHGPTWPLAEKLAPLLEEAGVSLYISGLDPIMQHIKSVPYGSVDYVGVGNGANFNESQAQELPNLRACPYGSLAFQYGSTTGFLGVLVTSATAKQGAAMTVTFFDDVGNELYSFTKAPSRAQAFAAGSAAASAKRTEGTLAILGGLFLVVAVGLCLFGASYHARFVAGPPTEMGANWDQPGNVRPPIRNLRGVSEYTPLTQPQSRPASAGRSSGLNPRAGDPQGWRTSDGVGYKKVSGPVSASML